MLAYVASGRLPPSIAAVNTINIVLILSFIVIVVYVIILSSITLTVITITSIDFDSALCMPCIPWHMSWSDVVSTTQHLTVTLRVATADSVAKNSACRNSM